MSPSQNNDTNNDNNDLKTDVSSTTAETRQRTIAYLLFGIDLDEAKPSDDQQESAAKKSSIDTTSSSPRRPRSGLTKPTDDIDDNNTKNDSTYHHKLKAALDEIDRHIPFDRAAIRQSPLFGDALPALQWQRDNYLVGPEYANWRKRDKERGRIILNPTFFRIPYDYSQAMVHAQLRPILADFIPSETVVQALTPLVADLPSGILYDTISGSTIDIIQFQSTNLNYTFKDQLLSVLKDPSIRNQIKASMQGFMIKTSESTAAFHSDS